MKKIIMISLLLITGFSVMAMPYYKKCKGCQSEYNREHGCTDTAPAWRDFETPIKEKNGKRYATYRCQYGHVFLAEIE